MDAPKISQKQPSRVTTERITLARSSLAPGQAYSPRRQKQVAKSATAILLGNLSDRTWRLSNLYWILDKQAKTVKFRPNWAQLKFLDELHGRDIILKARQLGFSTLIDLVLLDCALFTAGYRVGIVADTEDTAKELMATKIKFPYEHLPVELQRAINLTVDSVTALEFTNGSCVHVGVTLRAGTYNAVHVSEFGKISVEHPDKAQEIVTGTLETVPLSGMVFMESTAMGRSGLFWEWWQRAVAARQAEAARTPLDYEPHFFPWYNSPEYTLAQAGVVISQRVTDYLDNLGVTLTAGQRAWYAKKEQALGEEMMCREYPSTPDEAFKTSLQGAYFARQLADCRRDGRVCPVPVEPVPIDTHWDLGMDDMMSLAFVQRVQDELHVVDYYENSGEGFEHYANVMKKKGYKYGTHYAPHDIQVRELSGKSRLELAAEYGLKFQVVPRIAHKADAIEALRQLFPALWFDEARCSVLLTHLEQYRKDWDDIHGVYRDSPAKSEHNHAADSMMTLAQSADMSATAQARAAAKRDRFSSPQWQPRRKEG